MSTTKQKFSGQVTTVQALDNTGPQTLRWLTFLNTTAAVAYLQIFNIAAASVTLGTTAPTLSIGVPASAAIVLAIPVGGQAMRGNALSIAGTTTRAGLTAAILHVNIGWNL